MIDDFELFGNSADDGEPIDPGIALFTAYLARELSPVQVIAVERRLATDAAFHASVAPLAAAWAAPIAGAGILVAAEDAEPAPASAEEIEQGWRRFEQVARADAWGAHRRRAASLARTAAVIALVAAPILAIAQGVRSLLHHGAAGATPAGIVMAPRAGYGGGISKSAGDTPRMFSMVPLAKTPDARGQPEERSGASPLLTNAAGPPATPNSHSAEDILNQMSKTYANATSYRDTGRVTTWFLDPGFVDEKPFATAFVRPDRFRFEYQHTNSGGPVQHNIIWQQGGIVQSWTDFLSGNKLGTPTLENAIAAFTGVSSASAYTIPSLLLPGVAPRGRPVTALTELVQLSDSIAGSHLCFRVQGRIIVPRTNISARMNTLRFFSAGSGLAASDTLVTLETLWVDKQSFVLRRIESRREGAGLNTITVTTYDPHLNEPVADSLLVFGPPK